MVMNLNVSCRMDLDYIRGYNYPLVICYIAIEHGHRNSDVPGKNGDFP